MRRSWGYMSRLRALLASERGFSLIEVLVGVLIVAILAMIALPAFLGQRRNADDLDAQAMVRTVAVTLDSRYADEDTYEATKAQLVAFEPSIGHASPHLVVDTTERTYEITERSVSGTQFTLARDGDGKLSRTCSVAGQGLCRADSTW